MEGKNPILVANGRRRMASLTQEERNEYARRAALTRMRNSTAEERREHARKAALASVAARRAKINGKNPRKVEAGRLGGLARARNMAPEIAKLRGESLTPGQAGGFATAEKTRHRQPMTTIILPQADLKRIRKLAEQTGYTMTHLARMAFSEFLKRVRVE